MCVTATGQRSATKCTFGQTATDTNDTRAHTPRHRGWIHLHKHTRPLSLSTHTHRQPHSCALDKNSELTLGFSHTHSCSQTHTHTYTHSEHGCEPVEAMNCGSGPHFPLCAPLAPADCKHSVLSYAVGFRKESVSCPSVSSFASVS